MNQEAPEQPVVSSKNDEPDAIIVRPWPKVIFLYPTFIMALVAGVWQAFIDVESPQKATIGLVFYMTLCFNLLVISFEFSRLKTVAIFFLLLALGFFLLFLSYHYNVISGLKNFLASLQFILSTPFYFGLAAYLAIIYLGVFMVTRWNYWEVRPNEIIHHTGFLGDIKRYPSPNLRMSKEINDVFEFLLLGSGRIVLHPASESKAVVLENVLNVNKVEDSVKRLLSAIKVQVSSNQTLPTAEEH